LTSGPKAAAVEVACWQLGHPNSWRNARKVTPAGISSNT
jgi:hypothetical protein